MVSKMERKMENLHYVEEHFKEEEEDCGDVIVVCDEN